MSPARSFTTGYHPFHPDVSINFQLNHLSDGSPASVTELTRGRAAHKRLPDFTRELLRLPRPPMPAGEPLGGCTSARRPA